MNSAFFAWLCGAVPAAMLVLDCRPRSLGEWLAAGAIVVLWPLAVLAFFVAMLRSVD